MSKKDQSEIARPVRVDLDKKGIVTSVYDEEEHTILPNTWGREKKPIPLVPYKKTLVHLDGEHFGWSLEQYDKKGVPIEKIYTRLTNVSANKKDGDSRNTVHLNPPILIMLDCGLWGAYKRPREYLGKKGGPQRDFGLIENGWVWLAQYVSALDKNADELKKITDATLKELSGTKALLADMLTRIVHEGGMGAIKLCMCDRADTTTMNHETKYSIYICFPDLHLSDKWPDLPPENQRHKNKKACIKLQQVLRDCQRWPGVIRGNVTSKYYAKKVQEYLEKLAENGLLEKREKGEANISDYEDFDKKNGNYILKRGLKKSYLFTSAEFLAEKDIVDRALRIHSTWFCGPGKKYVDNNRHTSEPPYGKKDDLLYKTLKEEAPGDAGSAFDLVNFLAAIHQLRDGLKDNTKDDGYSPELKELMEKLRGTLYTSEFVKVRQVGDMCEMWMNHEFLYHGFWVRKTGQGGGFPRMAIRRGVKGFISPKCEDFQARKDEYHFHPKGTKISKNGFTLDSARHAKWYTYNHMHTKDQKYRHVVGDMIKEKYYSGKKLKQLEKYFNLPSDEIKRRRYLLKKRMDSILAFYLPMPDKALSKLCSSKMKNSYLKSFYKKKTGLLREAGGTFLWEKEGDFDRRKQAEYGDKGPEILWNKLIWDLFKDELEGISVYGNHDGYRGDPLLWNDLDSKYRSNGWISEPGLWFEHAHRWDQYNRDGCAFGQGGTNMAYYYMHILGGFSEMGAFVKEGEKKYSKERQQVEVGAAIWYLVLHAHSKNNLDWFEDTESKLHPFGIYICGHSHGADLVSIFLEPKSSLKKKVLKRKLKESRDAVLIKKQKKSDKKRKKNILDLTQERLYDRPYLYKSEDLAKEESKRYQDHVAGNIELDWLKKGNKQ